MITRRELVAASAASAVAPVLQPLANFAPGSFSFAFFSDTHVGLKANLKENEAMLREIAAWNPAFAVNGGDVTDYGWRGEYANWRELRKILTCPVRCNMGNHDVRWSPLGPKAFREGTGEPLYSKFEFQGCHFFVLDSTVPLSHWGHFEREQLRWLEKGLKDVGREMPVFLFTHHWVGRDVTQIDDEAELARIVEPYNVKIVFNGHGHSDLLWTYEGMTSTMNKGLYQGSWQRIDVDREKGEVHLTRRSETKGKEGLLATVPLKASREKQAVFAPGFETRWDDGKYGNAAPTIPGVHIASVRTAPDTYRRGEQLTIKGNEPTWTTPLSGGVMSQMRADGDALFVTTMDGAAYRIDRADGRVTWREDTNGGYAHSSALITPNTITPEGRTPPLVIFGTVDGRVHALDRRTGKRRWTFATEGPVYGSAVLCGGIVAIPSGDGRIYGLDQATGKERWRYALPTSETAFVQSPLATDGVRIFAGAWDKHVHALDGLTGALVWRKDGVGTRSFAYSPAIGNPVAAGGRVIVPANGNVLWAFRATDGEVLWQSTAEGDKFGYSSPRIEDDRIYVGSLGDAGLGRCVSLSTGEAIWSAATGSTIYDAGPALTTRHAVFASVSGLLSAADKVTGEISWRYQMPPGHLLSTPLGIGDSLYAASYANTVMAWSSLP